MIGPRLFAVAALFAFTFSVTDSAAVAGQKPPLTGNVSSSDALIEAAPGQMTSAEVLKKVSEIYKSAATYYEESRITTTSDGGGKHTRRESRLTAAFRRPDTLKEVMIGEPNDFLTYYKDGEMTVLWPGLKRYRKVTGQTLLGMTEGLPSVRLAITDDLYVALTQAGARVKPLKKHQLAGKPVYEVGLELARGSTTFCFDQATLRLVEATETIVADTPQGVLNLTVKVTVEKSLFNELPRDASGKEMDIFAFEIPKDSVESP